MGFTHSGCPPVISIIQYHAQQKLALQNLFANPHNFPSFI